MMKHIKKSLLLFITLSAIFIGNSAFAQSQDPIDLKLEIIPTNTAFSELSNPTLNIFLVNNGTQVLDKSNIPPGFLTCTSNGMIVYESKLISNLVINPGTKVKKTITLEGDISAIKGDKKLSCFLKPQNGETSIQDNSVELTIPIIEASRFDISINRAIDPIKNNLDAPEIKGGIEGVNNFLLTKVMDIIVPLIIVLGILISILGFYKILFSSEDKAISDGAKLIGFGVLGIILIMSAKFFAGTIYMEIFMEGDLRGANAIQGFKLAQNLYELIFFPFIKIGIYLSLSVLFVMLVARVITFVFGTDEDTRKKAGTIITWNVIGMLIIIGSKQIIEFVYGQKETVVKSISNLGEIGTGILATKNLPILYQVVNWAMGLASLFILIMVLVQAFQLLMKPDDPDAMKKIKNSLLYIFIGIIIIGTGYIIINFLIID